MAGAEQIVRVQAADASPRRPVVDLEPADVSIAWHSGDTRDIVMDFVSAACDAFDRAPPVSGVQSA